MSDILDLYDSTYTLCCRYTAVKSIQFYHFSDSFLGGWGGFTEEKNDYNKCIYNNSNVKAIVCREMLIHQFAPPELNNTFWSTAIPKH